MEDNKHLSLAKDSPEPLPSLIQRISSQELDCFDTVNRDIVLDTHIVSPSPAVSQYVLQLRFLLFVIFTKYLQEI